MSHFSNPTENAALGAVDRELKMMRRRARQLRVLMQNDLLTPGEFRRARKQFTGIYARVLRDVMNEPPAGTK